MAFQHSIVPCQSAPEKLRNHHDLSHIQAGKEWKMFFFFYRELPFKADPEPQER